jgi:hypothetical protein
MEEMLISSSGGHLALLMPMGDAGLGISEEGKSTRPGGRRTSPSQHSTGELGRIAEPTGTDGFRLLCHQFSPSSLPRLANCISRCNACEASEEPAAGSSPPVVIKQRRPEPKQPADGLPASQWPTVLYRVVEQKEPLRT